MLTPVPVVAALPSLVPFVAPEALEAKLGLKFRLRLGANESVFGPSPMVVEAINHAAGQIQNYGDPQNVALRQALAQHNGVEPEQIAVGPGIDGLLVQFCKAYLDPTRAVVANLGGYATFDYAAVGTGCTVIRVPYREDKPDLAALALAAVEARASVVYLANPDNPSGWFHDAVAVRKFFQSLPEDCQLWIDEAYAEFAREPMDLDDSRVVRFRTFSKAYGMAGVRIGYAICGGDQAAVMDRIRPHFEVSNLAQAAALAALQDQEFMRTAVAEAKRGVESIRKLADERGLVSLPSSTNFVLIDLRTPEAAEELLERLLRNAVFVRKPGAPPLNRCVRITTANPVQIALLNELWSE